MINMATLLNLNARFRPNHTAMVFHDQRPSYTQFQAATNRLANALAGLGIAKGDKVALLMPNRMEMLEAYWALPKLGAVSVPLSTLLLSGGLVSLLNDSDSKAVITTAAFAEKLSGLVDKLPALTREKLIVVDGPGPKGCADYHALTAAAPVCDPPPVDLDRDDTFNIMYTSGTTGEPKGIVHSHQIRSYYATLSASAFRMTPESVFLHTGSMVFNGAMMTFLPSMLLGATFILHGQFDPEEFIATVEREKVTHVIMVPSQLIAILNSPNFSPDRLASLEMICSVGAPLHQEYKDRLTKLLPNCFYELYGLTEGFLTILDRTDFLIKSGSVGSPVAFFEMKIADEQGHELETGQVGEIIGRGPFMMDGYYKRPDLTAQTIKGGWLHSGDLGYVDEEGYLYLVDRKKDMIISGGVNVYPRDIEDVVLGHPAVMECAVFGAPSEKWGETPVAAVIAKPGQTIDPEELKTFTNANVSAKFQRISQVKVMSDFPRNAAGKILKRVLRDEYSG